ncbi:MAG: AsnC family transcriptional regulator [Arthrobacter sp.]|jgi:Lrp/AsnC family transcriptional regulator for asnA, asnC and gidA|nr:AsnC family transcriptional regulator [Arthrobacter sp.]
MRTLDDLERGIAAALQINGRASFRSIAGVLGANERTVTRAGQALLNEGVVGVTGLRAHSGAVLLRTACTIGAAKIACLGVAQRPECTFAYTVTGDVDMVAELTVPTSRMSSLINNELVALPGIARMETFPVLKYFRTVANWRLGVLDAEQIRALRPRDFGTISTLGREPETEHAADNRIVEALRADGRISAERVAREVGVSETTARRRIDWLLERQVVQLRALVEPAAVGLPVEALLWLKLSPARLEEAGQAFARHPRVRYAAAVAGAAQLVVNVTASTVQEFYAFLTHPDWASMLDDVVISMVTGARKRGGWLLPPLDG